MRSTRAKQSETVRHVPDLQTAINRWLAARTEYKKQGSDENQYAYNAAYFALGEAWAEQHPNAFDVPGGFERFQSRLIAPEED